jgi:tetratricopeptide (TPR) repeat protein
VKFDRSAFNWLQKGECVVYTITFDAESGNDGPEQQTYKITIKGANDAPVLTAPTHQTFVPMTEDDGPSAPRTVLSFRGSITDADHDAFTGIAITDTVGEGKWEFSLDGGQTWTCFTACPDEALLHFNAGVALEDQDQAELALRHYEACLRLTPQFADAHYNAARLHELLGHSSQAIRHYSEYRRLQRR